MKTNLDMMCLCKFRVQFYHCREPQLQGNGEKKQREKCILCLLREKLFNQLVAETKLN